MRARCILKPVLALFDTKWARAGKQKEREREREREKGAPWEVLGAPLGASETSGALESLICRRLSWRGPLYKVFFKDSNILFEGVFFSSGAPNWGPLRVSERWSFNPLNLGPSKSPNCTTRGPQIPLKFLLWCQNFCLGAPWAPQAWGPREFVTGVTPSHRACLKRIYCPFKGLFGCDIGPKTKFRHFCHGKSLL